MSFHPVAGDAALDDCCRDESIWRGHVDGDVGMTNASSRARSVTRLLLLSTGGVGKLLGFDMAPKYKLTGN